VTDQKFLDNNLCGEAYRLSVLRSLNILDSGRKKCFDDVTALVKQLFDIPIVLISLVDADRQWFKSAQGIDINQTDRDVAFCSYAIESKEILIIPDATKDDRFKNNPLVTGEPKIRFYAGAPLTFDSNVNLGTLCIIDSKPRDGLSQQEEIILKTLADNVVNLIRLKNYAADTVEKNNAQSEFLSNFSHEIRTPLNAIIGSAEILQNQKELSEVSLSFAKNITVSAKALLDMMNSIVDISAVEDHNFELNSEKFFIPDLLNEIEQILKGKALDKGLTFFFDFQSVKNHYYYGDKVRIRQALINLVNNAIKFTDHGIVMLAAHFEERPDGKSLMIEVKDSGIGMSKEEMNKVFDRFYQVKGKENKERGSGLGLTITKQIVEKLEGKIRCESEIGLGSKFTIELPDRTIEALDIKNLMPFETKRRILVVEDCLTQLSFLESILNDLGYETDLACDSEEAIALAEKNHYDIIFMDINLPGQNGLETSKAIKLGRGIENLPVVGMSSSAHLSDGFDKSTLDGFLEKPLSRVDIQEKLLSFIN